jgi:beta-mannanase/cellulose synthase/poly-beta-1,6-N-acetylglucosamine synthase-like glycosyltransferase
VSSPLLTDILNPSQRLRFRILVALWAISVACFWAWWFRHEHMITVTGLVINTLVLAWAMLPPAWCWYFVGRMKRTNPTLRLPGGRVAIIVTKAPSEPWSVLERTLRAMLNQRFPRVYDVWLADEDPTPATRAWCADHGVQVSCRKGVPGYQNKRWPGREKCKEGNLKYFYDRWGYDNYEFVAQLDADHAPDPEYLANMIRPFVDPRVGYVAAPSICDANAATSWSARGRLYAEAPMHGPMQAGSHDGFAPMCIGSHYAVRTRALREAGGLGPELAEDHSTTLLLNAVGWHGAFAIDAIAHGDGPPTFVDCMVQEFQWSRSLMTLLLQLTPEKWTQLTFKLRAQFLFCQLCYPMHGLHMVGGVALPLAALAIGAPWVSVSLAEFYGYSTVVNVLSIVIVVWLGRQGVLRPVDARVFTWEVLLYHLMRWPWVVLGVVDAIRCHVAGTVSGFRVTPKGAVGKRAVPSAMMAPYVLLAFVSGAIALLVDDPGEARGYYTLAISTAMVNTLVAFAAQILDARETGRPLLPALLPRPRDASIFAVFMAAAVTLSATTWRTPDVVSAFVEPNEPSGRVADTGATRAVEVLRSANLEGSSRPMVTPVPKVPAIVHYAWSGIPQLSELSGSSFRPVPPISGPADGRPTLALDPDDHRLVTGAFDPWGDFASTPMPIHHWYVQQDEADLFHGALRLARNTTTPMITIEPYPWRGWRSPVLDVIIAGTRDAEIQRLAQVAAAYKPQVILVRWGHEMELSGLYPWSANSPRHYIDAYRHVVGIFRANGADNVRFVWSPAGSEGLEAFYPGDDVVDYVGLTVLADAEWDAGWALPPQSFAELLRPRYDRVAGYGKPIYVAELGVSGDDGRKAKWMADAARAASEFDLLRGIVYFNDKNPERTNMGMRPDWRLSHATFGAFASALQPSAQR